MGLFDFFTIHVFSDVSGVVTFQGEAVEGVKIIRTADHEEDKVYTAYNHNGQRREILL